ncbi:hypothetical protein X907_1284 [Glycocaulis alkaliphilus]|uniref:Uncharacterized protein n=1 Tax=Glycocaulis alkaliphilus TaxID=1434191 RepID=A0A3T0E9T2_9PROT|nr:hypothetical protein X907_1284 [Glycocaulis alkaliphilus]
MPAQAGIQSLTSNGPAQTALGSRLRGNDEVLKASAIAASP